MKLIEETPYRWRIDRGAMRVPGVVFASGLLPDVHGDIALEQVANVATLPGIVEASYAMPDVHWGYGFPIGGVAATDVARGGVVSPGGVGFDISCGVRLLVSGPRPGRAAPRLPRDHGRAGPPSAARARAEGRVARATAASSTGSSRRAALRGRSRTRRRPATCDALRGRRRARRRRSRRGQRPRDERGLGQVGSLGSGNHFLEVQVVDAVYDDAVADAFGLCPGQVCVMIHSGSRGLGHQICSDHVRTMLAAMPRYGIDVPDRQLACAPVDSPEGAAYLGAMAAAANYGRANRQLLPEAARARVRRRRPRGAAWICCTTSRTTWPSSNGTTSTAATARCACTARVRPAPCRPAIPTSRPTWPRSASRC